MEPGSTDWSLITAENTDTLGELVENVLQSAPSSGQIKRKRGRPPKITPASAENTPVFAPDSGSTTPVLPRQPSPEELMKTADLVRVALKREESPKPTKLRFSGDTHLPPLDDVDEQELGEQLDQEILLKIYEQFFSPPLCDRHNIKKRNFDEKTPKKTLEAELKKLQRICGASDPASDLGRIWAGAMTFGEGFGVSMGYPLMGLGEVCQKKAQTPEMLDTFRELLIKYPKLRKWMVLGGFPEIKLALYSGMIAKEVMEENLVRISKASELLNK